MAEVSHEFERFFDREGFNRSLGHFQAVSALLDDFERYFNLADILNALLGSKEIDQEQLSPTVYALLVDKYGYLVRSYNLSTTIDDFAYVHEQVSSWDAVDIVVAYHHPDLGFAVINPKNLEHWRAVQSLRKNELITVFVGAFQNGLDPEISEKAAETLGRYLDGKKSRFSDALSKGNYGFKDFVVEEEDEEEDATVRKRSKSRPRSGRHPVRASDSGGPSSGEGEGEPGSGSAGQKAPVAPSGSRRMTPMYSVQVTNELFHNGNVEAWKKIIQSFNTKYEGCEVVVFYEGERIHDINTLFKWGKVKHGSTIVFAVVGETIRDVAKLQRYLRQGASPQFEAFLRVPVNTVLKLF